MTTALNNIRRFIRKFPEAVSWRMYRMDRWTLVKSQWVVGVYYYGNGFVSVEIEGFGKDNETKIGRGYDKDWRTAFKKARKQLTSNKITGN